MGLKVCKGQCANCLFTKDRIVSPSRFKEIVTDCKKTQTHFICHKTSDTVCKSYYDKFGFYSQLVRIAQRLGAIEFVDVDANDKLPTWEEMKRKPSKKR